MYEQVKINVGKIDVPDFCESEKESNMEEQTQVNETTTKTTQEVISVAALFDVPDAEEDFENDENDSVAEIYVGKPNGRIPIQVSPDRGGVIYTFEAPAQDGENETEKYLIDPSNENLINNMLASDDAAVKKELAVLAVTRSGQNFIWSIPEVIAGGPYRGNKWWSSALRIIRDQSKQKKWFKVVSKQNGGDGRYLAKEVRFQQDEPQFIQGNFDDLIIKAFEGRIIRSLDDEVVQKSL